MHASAWNKVPCPQFESHSAPCVISMIDPFHNIKQCYILLHQRNTSKKFDIRAATPNVVLFFMLPWK